MSHFFKHDHTQYAVGDPIYIQRRFGFNGMRAERYLVERKTPSGQIVARSGAQVIRINLRGGVIGENGLVCDETTAAKIKAQSKLDAAWIAIRGAIDDIDRSARAKDDEALTLTVNALLACIQKKRDLA